MMNSTGTGLVMSSRTYLTSLCASVATNTRPSGVNLNKTPDITGRMSSLPVAKIVFWMAVARISEVTTVWVTSSRAGRTG